MRLKILHLIILLPPLAEGEECVNDKGRIEVVEQTFRDCLLVLG